MQKSGFFNALLTNGEYDRKYNANDYSDNLAVVVSNGVLRSDDDDLKVTEAGMIVTVGVGRAWINGHYYKNDTPYSFAVVTAPTGGTRYDRVFLRLDKNLAVRSVSLVYQQGTASNNPTKPAPVRDGNIYDIVLADIFVDTNATSLKVTDTRHNPELCGWVYSTSGDNSFFTSLDNSFNEWFDEKKDTLSSVTLFKRYTVRNVLSAASKNVPFTIPQYDPETSFIEVYVNGMAQQENVNYTLQITEAANLIIFTNELVADTEIIINAYKSIDGTGIMSVADEITELQNAVAELNTTDKYDYICNGADDNVKLSEIAQAWLNSSTDNSSKTIKVYGALGAAAAYAGNGTSVSPYRWFSVGKEANTSRKIIFDFSNCEQILLPITGGTNNVVFYGHNANIIGVNLSINQTAMDTVVNVFNSTSGEVYAENCRFKITSYKDSRVGQTGTFNNCRAIIVNAADNSYCFLPFNDSLLRINGGEYCAYTAQSSDKSAIVAQTTTNAVTILCGVNAPTISRAGFYQTNSIIQNNGCGVLNCSDLISILSLSAAGDGEKRGTIFKNKPFNI